MISELQAVVFDFDGVIVDSLPGIAWSLDVALRSLGEPVAAHDEVRAIVGPPLRDGIGTLLAARKVDNDQRVIDAILTAYRADYVTTSLRLTRLHDGVRELLARLHARGLRTAVATSKPAVATLPLIELFELGSEFEIICCPRDGSSDTKADVLTMALQRLDLPGSSAAMVGDRSHDMAAAVAVGCVGIGALWGYGSHGELTAAGATHLADRPDDVDGLVRALR